MEEDVDKILVSIGNPEPVFLVILDHVAGPVGSSHHRQIHQHHPRVYPWRMGEKVGCVKRVKRQDDVLVAHIYTRLEK